MKRIAIFVSGNGTNMENLIREVQAGKVPAEVAVVICDKPGSGAIARAGKLGVEVALVDRKQFSDKASFETAMAAEVDQRKIDILVLAGFMRILSESFVNRYPQRIVNIHPSCLPAFPGAHAIRDAFEAKVKETGVTVHYVTPEVDCGPVILQRKVPVAAEDTLESLEAKVHAVEYQLYPQALRLLLQN